MTKYGAKKTEIDGIKFDSKVEARYYEHLKLKKIEGVVKSFEIQPSYELQPKFKLETGKTVRAINYVADFEVVNSTGDVIVVDIKGMATPGALLKRKLFIYKYHGITLSRICYVKKYGGWIDYFELHKLRRQARKQRK